MDHSVAKLRDEIAVIGDAQTQSQGRLVLLEDGDEASSKVFVPSLAIHTLLGDSSFPLSFVKICGWKNS